MVYNSTMTIGNFMEYSSTGGQLGILWNTALLSVKWEFCGMQLYSVSLRNFMEFSSTGC